MQIAVRLAKKSWAELSLVLASLGAYFYKLGSYRFFDGDEMIYHQVAHNINRTGDWVTLYWRFNPDGSLVQWFEKPPLIIWLKALLIRLPGQIEFWSRLPSAAAGLGTVLLTYAIGKRLYNKWVGLIAAFIVLTSPGLIHVFRIGRLDGPLIFFFWLAFYFALRLKEHPKFYYFLGASIGAAVMTKGATGLLIPVILFLWWLWDGQLKQQLRNRHLLQAVGLGVAIIVPWHLAELIRHGNAFWSQFFGFHVWQRIQESLTGNQSSPILNLQGDRTYRFYFFALAKRFYPWVLLVPFAVVTATRDSLRRIRTDHRLPIVTAAVIFVFFTLLKSKLVHYVAPAYPALALLCAALIFGAWQKRIILQLSLIAAGFLVLFFWPYTLSDSSAYAIAGILLLTVLALALKSKSNRTLNLWHGLVMISFGLLSIASFDVTSLKLYDVAYVQNAQAVAKVAQAVPRQSKPIIIYPADLETISPFVVMTYADQPVVEAYNLGILAANSSSADFLPIITSEEALKLLAVRYVFQPELSDLPIIYGRIKRVR